MKKTSLALALLPLLLPVLLAGAVRGSSGFQIVPLPPISDRNVVYGGSVMGAKFKLLGPLLRFFLSPFSFSLSSSFLRVLDGTLSLNLLIMCARFLLPALTIYSSVKT